MSLLVGFLLFVLIIALWLAARRSQ